MEGLKQLFHIIEIFRHVLLLVKPVEELTIVMQMVSIHNMSKTVFSAMLAMHLIHQIISMIHLVDGMVEGKVIDGLSAAAAAVGMVELQSGHKAAAALDMC